jgi:two-component system, chemotaxis family, protein-glutamate methylesterase/glutaminase
VRAEILQKVLLVRSLRPSFVPTALIRRQVSGAFTADGKPTGFDVQGQAPYRAPTQVVAIASSTGGPSALLSVFGKLTATTTAAFLVAQHMPDKFTRTFAERLDKRGPVRTAEAQDGDVVGQAMGFVCPGRKCMELVFAPSYLREGPGSSSRGDAPSSGGAPEIRLRVGPAAASDRYVPSADKLFRSAAAAGARCIGVILTGMGDDGVDGARAIRDAGGMIIAESQETAVVNGMPGAAVRAGVASKVLPLPQIAEFLAGVGS